MLVLGIETSCDETAVALVEDGVRILSSVVESQVDRHRVFGGVVPEIAAREHVLALLPVLEAALAAAERPLRAVDLIAVTDRPGLLAALLAGTAAAEALGLVLDRPVVGVNHVEAHLVAPFLAAGREPTWPFLSLVASGGHTHLFRSTGPLDHELLGATLDDAAGEAFDKVARILGLGYPGGPGIQAAAERGDPRAFPFKRSYLGRTSLDFSFSGLKTAVLYRCFGQTADGRAGTALLPGIRVEDVAASFQAAVVDVLVKKVRRAVERTGIPVVGVGGGVACNGPLRACLAAAADRDGFELLLAPPALCTDNAAMVAARGTQVHSAAGAPRPPRPRARGTWTRVTV
jgi:N6-L-threonylcarbamoyladenine synthase